MDDDTSMEGMVSSSDGEEESLPSSLSACHFFDVAVDTSSSSLAYLHLFSLEAIGLLCRMESYKCQHSGLYGVIGDHSNEACTTVQ
jgi:hypothetical protein